MEFMTKRLLSIDMEGDTTRLVLGILGNATASAFFLSPLPTFWKIVRSKSTSNYSPLPYVASFLNCLLWTWYGFPYVTNNNLLVLTINGAGAIMEFLYLTSYFIFTSKKKKIIVATMFFAILLFVGITITASMIFLQGSKRELFVGLLCVIFTICMYASPLSVMRLVISTKSVQYMPFLLSFFTFINTSIWLAYGVLGHDIFIMIPNGIGSLLGIAQLILYGVYRNGQYDSKIACVEETRDTSNCIEIHLSKPSKLY